MTPFLETVVVRRTVLVRNCTSTVLLKVAFALHRIQGVMILVILILISIINQAGSVQKSQPT